MTHSDEQEFKKRLEANAREALRSAGIDEGQTVLDYGSGAGAFTIAAATIVGESGKVYALDSDAEALATVRRTADDRRLTNIETALADGAVPVASFVQERVDAILLYDVLHLVEGKRSLLGELHAVLKPSGFLSVFPMHIGAEGMLQIMREAGLFTPRDRWGMILNFTVCDGPGTRREVMRLAKAQGK